MHCIVGEPEAATTQQMGRSELAQTKADADSEIVYVCNMCKMRCGALQSARAAAGAPRGADVNLGIMRAAKQRVGP